MADGPKLTGLGKFFIVLFVAGCIGGAYYLFVQRPKSAGTKGSSSGSDSVFDSFSSSDHAEFGIAYGTEKERWLKWAVDEFAKTRDGKKIKVNLIPMGSLEGGPPPLYFDQRLQILSPPPPPPTDTL